LTQGIVGGVVAGLVLVAILSWRETRVARGGMPVRQGDEPGRPPRTVAGRVLRGTTNVLILVFGCFVFLMIGVFVGGNGPKHDRYDEERALIQPILLRDPAFAGVTIDERTWGGGGAELGGEVTNPADATRLREAIIRRIGESRAADLVRGITVSSPRPGVPASQPAAE
jgi:hypothetical protein